MVSRLQKLRLKRKVRAAYNQAHTFLFKRSFCKRLHARKRKEALDCNPSPLKGESYHAWAKPMIMRSLPRRGRHACMHLINEPCSL